MYNPARYTTRRHTPLLPVFPLRPHPTLDQAVFSVDPRALDATIGYRSPSGSLVVPPRTPVYPIWDGRIVECSLRGRGLRIVVQHRFNYTTVYDGLVETHFYGLGVCRQPASRHSPLGFIGSDEGKPVRPLYLSMRWTRKPAGKPWEIDPVMWLREPAEKNRAFRVGASQVAAGGE
jgi:hypothetical protein